VEIAASADARPPAATAPCGVLLLDKPLGLSSSAATQRVRRLLGGAKAGHVGSLDPLATGMLPICVGEATKVAGEILEGRKTYRFTVRLGGRTATGDAEGEVVETRPVPALSVAAAADALAAFRGESEQVPPMYSAIKRDGEPLYRLARRGVTIERPARRITVFDTALLGIVGPDLDCRIVCGKGTYVRVIAEDLARHLGTCGYVVALRREAVEPFEGASMVTLDTLNAGGTAGQPIPLIAADAAVAHLPAVHLGAEAAARLGHGQAVPIPLPPAEWPTGTVRVYQANGRVFLGLGACPGDGSLRPRRLFVASPTTQLGPLVGQGSSE
jgi:tRNA pseudouridine55 synthase